MKIIYFYYLLATIVLSISLLACRQPAEPDVPVLAFPPREEQVNENPEQGLQESTPSQEEQDQGYVIRNIVVDNHNSVFSIGIPSGQQEQTKVEAEKAINFWFEYLPAEAKLEVDGTEVERDTFHWETKIRYTESVTTFEYCIYNTTRTYISYNLHLVPIASADSIPVTVRQRWLPLQQ